MTAISATRRTVKELVDGTLRVTVDVEPMHKAAFLLAFPEVDAPIALAPLNYGNDKDRGIDDPNYWTGPGLSKSLEQADKLKGVPYKQPVFTDTSGRHVPKPKGPGELIEDPETREALDKAFKPKGGPHSQDAGRICKDAEFQSFLGVPDEKAAAAQVRIHCGIESRAELDHNTEALQRFHKLMREFNEWRDRNVMSLLTIGTT